MQALVAALLHGADNAEVARLTIWIGGIAMVAAVMLAWLALPGATAWGISLHVLCLGLASLGAALVAAGAIWRIRLWRRERAENRQSSP
jgi:hypothetical protein